MVIGSEFRASTQLQMMQRQISLWLNTLDTNADLLKTLDSNDRSQLLYAMNILRDHLQAYSLKIIS